MKFSKPITEIIKKRTSRRTYIVKLLEQDVKDRLIDIMELKGMESPFSKHAGKIRFEIVSTPEWDPMERKKLGTYGVIKGAQEFIVGIVEKSEYNLQHFGYLMEYIILAATNMDLGTCWLGGFFNRNLFSIKVNRRPNEIVPAITPIGYIPEKRSTKERLVRKYIKADKRWPWKVLFFEGDFNTPLLQENAGNCSTLLEMVRLGPSAGNKQPWRIIKDPNKNIFHFYFVEGTRIYKKFPPIDIGIATCHWDLTAKELEIDGKWEIKQPDIPGSGQFKYVISWIGV